MKTRTFLILITGILTLLNLACTTRDNIGNLPAPVPGEKTQQTGAVSSEGWEANWEKTVQTARKEGNVVVQATSVGPFLKEAGPILEKKYGVTLEILSKRGGELMTGIMAERRAGIYRSDVLITGLNTFFGEIAPAGIAEPLEKELLLPDILNKNNWYGNELPWGNDKHTVINMYAYPNSSLAVNSDMVRPETLKSYWDILDPKYKGKIIMNDPTLAGTGLKSFSALGYKILNLDFFRQLAKQEPLISRDQRLQVNWIAQAKYYILLFPRSSDMTDFMDAGAHVAFALPKEGTYLSRDGGGISLMNKAPHPNAARLLINYILSKEGLEFISRAHGVQSARVDVSTEGIDPLKLRVQGASYFTGADDEEWIARDAEFKSGAEDIFKAFLK